MGGDGRRPGPFAAGEGLLASFQGISGVLSPGQFSSLLRARDAARIALLARVFPPAADSARVVGDLRGHVKLTSQPLVTGRVTNGKYSRNSRMGHMPCRNTERPGYSQQKLDP